MSTSGLLNRLQHEPWTIVYLLSTSLVLLWLVYTIVYRLAFDPLRKIPGPFWARLTRLWEFNATRKGNFHKLSIALHQKYGPVVRIAPNKYDILDEAAVKRIYALGNGFAKSDFYDAFGDPHQRHLLNEKSNERHAAMRRKMASLYSISNLLSYEGAVDRQTAVLMDTLSNVGLTNQIIDMPKCIQYYAFDVIGEMTTGESLGLMRAGDDRHGIIDVIDKSMVYAALIGLVPEWHPRIVRLMNFLRVPPPFLPLINYISAQIEKHRQTKGATGDSDFLSKLFVLEAEGKMNADDIFACCGNNIVAGSDTTAISLNSALYNVYMNPRILETLRVEIDSMARAGEISNPVTYQEAQKMPYLQAVIKEALRFHPAVGKSLSRIVPFGGATMCGYYFPEGTEVGVNAWSMHYDTTIFGPDAAVFRPERWLEDDKSHGNRVGNLFSFGGGSRVCIGKNISLLEMAKVLPQIIRTFDLKIEFPERDLHVEAAWFVKQKYRCWVEGRVQPGS